MLRVVHPSIKYSPPLSMLKVIVFFYMLRVDRHLNSYHRQANMPEPSQHGKYHPVYSAVSLNENECNLTKPIPMWASRVIVTGFVFYLSRLLLSNLFLAS